MPIVIFVYLITVIIKYSKNKTKTSTNQIHAFIKCKHSVCDKVIFVTDINNSICVYVRIFSSKGMFMLLAILPTN